MRIIGYWFVATVTALFILGSFAIASKVSTSKSGSSSGGSGDVVGPSSATDTAIATYNGTTGKLIKDNSAATITAGGVIIASGHYITSTLGFDLDKLKVNGEQILFGSADITIPAFDFVGTNTSSDHLSIVRIQSQKAGNMVLVMNGYTSQSVDLEQFRDVSDVVLSGVNKNGNQYLHCYAGTGLPTATIEGEIICNNTDHVICTWNGTAWKRFDGTTACH